MYTFVCVRVSVNMCVYEGREREVVTCLTRLAIVGIPERGSSEIRVYVCVCMCMSVLV